MCIDRLRCLTRGAKIDVGRRFHNVLHNLTAIFDVDSCNDVTVFGFSFPVEQQTAKRARIMSDASAASDATLHGIPGGESAVVPVAFSSDAFHEISAALVQCIGSGNVIEAFLGIPGVPSGRTLSVPGVPGMPGTIKLQGTPGVPGSSVLAAGRHRMHRLHRASTRTWWSSSQST